MKNSATVLLAVFFLLAGCSKEATLFFLKPSESYTTLQKPQKAEKSVFPDKKIDPAGIPEPEPATLLAATTPTVPVLPASTASATAFHGSNSNPGETKEATLTGNATETQPVLQPAQQKPVGKKKAMVGKAETGFALSLFGVVSIALLFISPYFLYFSGLLTVLGVIFSFLGLLKVRESNGKLRGKVRALAGLVLGLLGTALVVLLLNSQF